MWATSLTSGGLRILRYSRVSLPPVPSILFPSSSSTLLPNFRALAPMDNNTINSFASLSISSKSGGRGRGIGRERGLDVKDNHGGRGRGGGSSGTDRIDALGRLMTRILRHMASELNLNMRSDGYVKVTKFGKLNTRSGSFKLWSRKVAHHLFGGRTLCAQCYIKTEEFTCQKFWLILSDHGLVIR